MWAQRSRSSSLSKAPPSDLSLSSTTNYLQRKSFASSSAPSASSSPFLSQRLSPPICFRTGKIPVREYKLCDRSLQRATDKPLCFYAFARRPLFHHRIQSLWQPDAYCSVLLLKLKICSLETREIVIGKIHLLHNIFGLFVRS